MQTKTTTPLTEKERETLLQATLDRWYEEELGYQVLEEQRELGAEMAYWEEEN